MRVLSYDPSSDFFFVDVTWDEFRQLAGKYEIQTGDMGVEEVIADYKVVLEDQKEMFEQAGDSFQQYLRDLYGIDDMPSVCLCAKRDLSELRIDQYNYPFDHMWNGWSPWKRIETVAINDLSDLAALECVEKGRDNV